MKLVNKILLDEVKPRAAKLGWVLVLILLAVGFRALAPLPFKILIDNVLNKEPLDKSGWLGQLLSYFSSPESLALFAVLLFTVSTIMISLSEYFSSVNTKKFSKQIVRSFSQKAFDGLQKLSMQHYKTQKVGENLYRLSYDVSALGNIFEDGILPLTSNLLYILATVVILFLIDVRLALLSVAILPILAFGLYIFNRKTNQATEQSEKSNSLLFGFIEEVLNQLRTIQSFNRQKEHSDVFGQKEDVALGNELTVFGLGYLLDVMIGVMVGLGYGLVILFGIRDVFDGRLSAGLLIAFIFYLDNLAYPLISLLTGVTAFKEQYIKFSNMAEFFKPEFYIKDKGQLTTIENPEIIFKDATIYGSRGVPILKKVSFKIPVGKRTVLVGVSGSGKTTIASTILRFFDPGEGEVLIGGKNIMDYSVQSIRETISYLPQETILFNDTIKNNIAFGNPRATFEEIEEAAKLAHAEEFIMSLAKGYDFEVGLEGTNLSGGQRQRILLARAFLKKNAQILIFDEPISSLDIKTRKAVLKSIYDFGQNKTTIIISNILEVADDADQVILINEGEILHTGKSATLKESSHLAHLIFRA